MGKLRDQLAAAQAARENFEKRNETASESIVSAPISDREKSLTVLLTGLVAFYLVVRFGFTTRLDAISDYASYIFELSIVALAVALLRPRLVFRSLLRPATIAAAAASLAAGYSILKLALALGLTIPIDVHSRETLVFLLFVAPLLEEALFRFVLWTPIERLRGTTFAMITTSVLFSYSHLHAIWFVPVEYDHFLLFQTAYTLALGLACAWMLRSQRSLLAAVALHFAFNLGFFLAF